MGGGGGGGGGELGKYGVPYTYCHYSRGTEQETGLTCNKSYQPLRSRDRMIDSLHNKADKLESQVFDAETENDKLN